MWEDGPAPASVVYVADAWVRGLTRSCQWDIPRGVAQGCSWGTGAGYTLRGRLFSCWSPYATTDRASYTSLPGWYFVLIYNAMEVVGAAPHAKCIEFDGRRSLIAGAFCNCVVESNLRKRHYFVEVVVGVRLPIFLQCDGIING